MAETLKRVLLAMALASLTLACGPQAMPEPAAPSEQTDETPQRGGLLHLPARPTFDTKDPFRGAGGDQLGLKSRPAYEPLIAFKAEPGTNFRMVRQVVPWLAEKWEQPTRNELILTLRQGVKFHDGVEMTSADVVHSFNRAIDPETRYVNGGAIRGAVDHVEALDKYKVRVALKGFTPDTLYNVLSDNVKVIPKHVENLEQVAVGTGPFKLVTLDNQKGLSFERNPDYWDKDRPYLDGIVVHRLGEDSAMVAAMSTGRLDAYNPGLLPQLQQMQASVPGFQHAEYTEIYANAVLMRLDKPPFSDIRVRRAMHLALDRQRLIEVALFGKGLLAPPSTQPGGRWAIPQEELLKMPGFRQPKDQDMAEAKRLMAEAGYPNGFKLEMKFRPGLSSSNSIAEPVASSWKDLGIEINLRPLDTGVFEQDRRNVNYDAVLSTTGGERNFSDYQQYYHSKGLYAGYGINDPELDQMITAAQEEFDDAKRLQLAHAIQRRIMDNVYSITTVERISFAGWQRWLKNYLYNPGAQVIPLYTPAITYLDHSTLPDFRKGEKLPF